MSNGHPITLSNLGHAVWKHKTNKDLFVCRSYDWVDRVLVIDESIDRRVVSDEAFTTFDFTEWTPVTPEEFVFVKRRYKDIYEYPK